jgi:SAM-dependent methyltransferase
MTEADLAFFAWCRRAGWVLDPLLEIGAGVRGAHPRLVDLAREWGMQATSTDLEAGDGIDVVADFAAPQPALAGRFRTVTIFSVLEHVFDPITVFGHAVECCAPGGTLLVSTPAVWPIHHFPLDCTRLLPDWYRQAAKRFALTLRDDAFFWLSSLGRAPVGDTLPSWLTSAPPLKRGWSRLVHRVFHTYGRSHPFTHAAIAAVFVR